MPVTSNLMAHRVDFSSSTLVADVLTAARQWWSAPDFVFSDTTFLGAWYWPVLASLLYVFATVGGQRIMQGRSPFSVSVLAQMHNAFLCVLSAVMLLGCLQGLLELSDAPHSGDLWCARRGTTDDAGPGGNRAGTLTYWMYVFYLSKYYEFFDTLLLVLKRKPTRFLHVWHHATVAIVCQAWLWGQWTVAGWIPVVLNCGVHVAMYYYYWASQAYGSRPWWARYLTQMQIGQFVLNFVAGWVWLYGRLVAGYECVGSVGVVWLSQAINTSFLVLFVQMYRASYAPRNPEQRASVKTHVE